ncbi:MAG TPA: RNA-guided pseudouridylation complex pseudouridine synthase subunit Cbf5 [Candidatus Thermoplasmatota archaeon]|nr:RNA-guided pseudouridylation complex pseudouridine synthase subunit Cbf5 [Candidatus Thermoplasmatota archaeon]
MSEKISSLPSLKQRKRLMKASVSTNVHYGKAPVDRTVRELLHNGFINLDKPAGPTSHQVVAWVKEILELEKAGHGGTLDPAVTGVLPVAVGDAARALQVLLVAGKEYIALMKLHKQIEEKKIRVVCKSFVGEISQMPPLRSAVKRVRRTREVYYLDILEVHGTEVLFRVGCEAGTYIRTLCVDIGKKLGCGAQLAELRRTRVGNITEDSAVTLQDVKDAYIFWKQDGDDALLRKTILSMERLLEVVPKIVVRDSAIDALCHGANLAIPGVVEIDDDMKVDEIAAVLSLKGEGVALVKMEVPSAQVIEKDTGICASLERVLMNKGTYPSIWKKT